MKMICSGVGVRLEECLEEFNRCGASLKLFSIPLTAMVDRFHSALLPLHHEDLVWQLSSVLVFAVYSADWQLL